MLATPGVFTDPDLAGYREWLSVFSYEGQKPLHGSFFSPNIEDYYVSPFELGYGKSIAFNHDFYGRDALEAARPEELRRKVTFVYDDPGVGDAIGSDYFNNYARYRVEKNGRMVGMTFQTGMIGPIENLLSLGLIEPGLATPGTEVEIVFGEHPGPGNDPDGDFGFRRLKATVAASPFNDHARSEYRKD